MNYLKMKKRQKERSPQRNRNIKIIFVNGGKIQCNMATAPAEFARFGKELNKLAYPTEGEVDQAAVCAVTTKWLERIFGRTSRMCFSWKNLLTKWQTFLNGG